MNNSCLPLLALCLHGLSAAQQEPVAPSPAPIASAPATSRAFDGLWNIAVMYEGKMQDWGMRIEISGGSGWFYPERMVYAGSGDSVCRRRTPITGITLSPDGKTLRFFAAVGKLVPGCNSYGFRFDLNGEQVSGFARAYQEEGKTLWRVPMTATRL